MRTITHTHSGQTRFELTVDAGTVGVFAEDRDTATVTLEPIRPGDREAARLVEGATVTSDGVYFSVQVPSGGGASGSGTTVVQRGSGTVFMSGGTVTGSITGLVLGAGNVTIVNGQVISGHGTTIVQGSAGIRAVVRLPLGSAASIRTQSAEIATNGPLSSVDTETISGDALIGWADTVSAHTTSGDVHVNVAGQMSARTVSGDVTVRALGGNARVRTVSGDIEAHAVRDCTVTTQSVSGDITVTAEPGVQVETDTRTVSGRTRNRNRCGR